MKFETKLERMDPDVTVVHITGRLGAGPDCKELGGLIQDLLVKNQKKVVFDMAGVEYIDSAGIGAIVWCVSNVVKGSGRVCLAAVPDGVRCILKMTGIFFPPVYPTVLEAAESLAGPPEGAKHDPPD